MTTLRSAGISDPGQVRGQNQDTFLVADDLVLIADGMGGYAGGEVAAEIAADVVGERFSQDASPRGLAEAFRAANRRIFERGSERGLEGMGTTLVAAALVRAPRGERLLIANVGDSRAYLLRDGALRQLTEDHSVAAELVRLGRIDVEQEGEHPGRHVLTRALGVDRDVAPDLVELEPRDGDRLLLCSDGLSNELGDPEMLALLAVGEPSDAARALVAAANAHGGLDNITAVVTDVALDGVASGPPAARNAQDEATGPPTGIGTPPVAGPAAASGAGAPGAAAAGAATSAVPVVGGTVTTSVPVVPAAAPGSASSVPVVGAPLHPMLTRTQRLRRRYEDRRARRAVNRWVSLRGAAFLVLLAAVVVVGYGVLRWYGTSNYVVTLQHRHVAIYKGQVGGFLWWPGRLVVLYPYGQAEVLQSAVPELESGVSEPSLEVARRFVHNLHEQWLISTGRVTPGSTTTTTTYAPVIPPGTT